MRYKYTPKKRQPQTWFQLIENQEIEMEDINLYQQEENSSVIHEDDTTLHNFNQAINTCQVMERRLWYKNSNDEDI